MEKSKMTLAPTLYAENFTPARTPRSAMYKQGALDALLRIFQGDLPALVPFDAGSAEFDAYIAGRAEGHQIAAGYMAACKAGG